MIIRKIRIAIIMAIMLVFTGLSGCIFNDDDDSNRDENDANNNNEGDENNGGNNNGDGTDNQSSSLPGAITSISLDSGDTTLTLVWTVVEGVEEYNLYKMSYDNTVFTDEMINDMESCSDPDFNCDSIRAWNAWQTSFLDSSDYDVITNSDGGNQISYAMTGLNNGEEYMFYVVASNNAGNGGPSAIVSGTPNAPELIVNCQWPSGISTDFPGDEYGGGLHSVSLYDLSWNLVHTITIQEIDKSQDPNSSTPRTSFTSLSEGDRYIAVCIWNGFGGTEGPLLAAITDTYNYRLVVNVNLRSELAMNLIIASEPNTDSLTPSSLTRDLDDLLSEANIITERLFDFHSSSDFSYRQFESNADRDADSIYSIVREALSRGKQLNVIDLGEVNIQSHGGGLDGIRTLSDMYNNPIPPLIEMIMFDRMTSAGQTDVVWSDPMLRRWDISQVASISPSVTVGGSKSVFLSTADILIGGEQQDGWVQGAWSRDFGQTEITRLTSTDYFVVSAKISPDESMLAFAGMKMEKYETAHCDLFVYRFSDSTTYALTNYSDDNYYHSDICDGVNKASWSPDGNTIMFDYRDKTSTTGYNASIYSVPSDGSSNPLLVLENDSWWFITPEIAPTGDTFAFSCGLKSSTFFEICEAPTGLDADSTWRAATYFDDVANELGGQKASPSFSVDGLRIIFTYIKSDGSGGFDYSFVVIDRFSGVVLSKSESYAGSEILGSATYSATEYTLMPRVDEGYEYNEYGQVIIPPASSDNRYFGSSIYNSNPYFRETIPAANNMGITFAVYDW